MYTMVLCFLLIGPSVPLTSGSHVRKRSDDLSLASLAVEVSQMASQMTSLSAQLTALQNLVTSQQTSLTKLLRTVGFYAYASYGDHFHPVLAPPGGTLVLAAVVTNVGGGYDSDTGFFTPPVSGLYQFHATFMAHPANQTFVHASIVVDGQIVASTISDSRDGLYDNVGVHPVLRVNAGSKVHVVNTDSVLAYYYTGYYLTFSGFLVQAD